MNNNNPPVILYLFKLKGDTKTYIAGVNKISYVTSQKIQHPLFVESESTMSDIGSITISPCNAYPVSAIDFSILLNNSDILYSLHQDFIPKEVISAYKDWWKRLYTLD